MLGKSRITLAEDYFRFVRSTTKTSLAVGLTKIKCAPMFTIIRPCWGPLTKSYVHECENRQNAIDITLID
jgi:hypothetical protein